MKCIFLLTMALVAASVSAFAPHTTLQTRTTTMTHSKTQMSMSSDVIDLLPFALYITTAAMTVMKAHEHKNEQVADFFSQFKQVPSTVQKKAPQKFVVVPIEVPTMESVEEVSVPTKVAGAPSVSIKSQNPLQSFISFWTCKLALMRMRRLGWGTK